MAAQLATGGVPQGVGAYAGAVMPNDALPVPTGPPKAAKRSRTKTPSPAGPGKEARTSIGRAELAKLQREASHLMTDNTRLRAQLRTEQAAHKETRDMLKRAVARLRVYCHLDTTERDLLHMPHELDIVRLGSGHFSSATVVSDVKHPKAVTGGKRGRGGSGSGAAAAQGASKRQRVAEGNTSMPPPPAPSDATATAAGAGAGAGAGSGAEAGAGGGPIASDTTAASADGAAGTTAGSADGDVAMGAGAAQPAAEASQA